MLFTRKAQAALKRPTDTSATVTPTVKEENHNIITNATQVATLGSLIAAVNNTSASNVAAPSLISSALSISNKLSGGLNQLAPLSASLNQVSSSLTVKSPKRNARHKRLNEMRSSGSVSPKKSPNRTMTTGLLATSALATSAQPASTLTAAAPTLSLPASSSLGSYQHIPDTFRVYRTNNERDVSDSDDDDMSDISGSPCSSCSGISGSGTGSDYDSSDDDEEDDDDEDDEDEVEAEGGDDNNTRDRPDIEMNDSTTIGDDVGAGNNGQAMICSGDSDTDGGAGATGGRITHVGNDSDTQTRSITRRTPTPLDKRQRGVGRPKLKKKLAQSPAAETTTSPLPQASAGNVAPAKASTRSASNKPAIRTSTPTPNNVNSIKTRKAHHAAVAMANNSISSRSKANNISSAGSTASLDLANSNSATDNLLKPPLEPLQLVWAKCRGYPWYPALILDPKTPKGFVYNGVPLPAPPTDVLALRKNYPNNMEVFLVLFFDAKRTWQWLPANKLDILGIDKEVDQQKLVESRKPTERKAVKKAYQDALHYQSQVSDLEGQGPDPIM